MGPTTIPNVLLIDNTLRKGGSKTPRVLRLEKILRSFPSKVRTIHFPELSVKTFKDEMTDRIVLSGSDLNISKPLEREKVAAEIDIIRDTELPVLGICFGFHVILHSFGCTVKRNESSGEFHIPDGRNIIIHVRDDDGGIIGNGPHHVNVCHRDFVSPEDPILHREFTVHSESRDGDLTYVQYAKHRSRPIHAVQFHPEAYDSSPERVRTTGERIIHDFLRTLS